MARYDFIRAVYASDLGDYIGPILGELVVFSMLVRG